MKNKKIIYSFLTAMLVLLAIFGWQIAYSKNEKLEVIFLNVGQGDAILIMQGNKQLLIDGGPDGKTLMAEVGKYIPFWDRKIEMIVATHPDQDHIEGLVEAMKNYEVGAVLESGAESDSGIYKKYREIIAEKKIQNIEIKAGENIKFGEDVNLKILNPPDNENFSEKETNSASVVTRLSFGKNIFLLTGDLPLEKEATLANSGENWSVDVLKIAHHGSKYSTGDDFLARIKPKEAVISVGKNSYGHPSPEVIKKLEEKKIKIRRTDQDGDVIYSCENPETECVVVK